MDCFGLNWIGLGLEIDVRGRNAKIDGSCCLPFV